MARFRFLEHDGLIAFAHRGGAAENPENTWASFTHAYGLGYRFMETDVHATSDGVVAVIHDPDLQRVSGDPRLVRSTSWAELSKVRLEGGESIPRLDELLEHWPDARWNIDAKHDSAVAPLVETLRRSGAVDRVCVTSFSDRRLNTVMRALGPSVCTAMGTAAVTMLRVASLPPKFADRIPLAPFRRFGAVQVPTHYRSVPVVEPRFISAAHRAGLQVHVWTVDDEAEMARLVDLGVDGIMTDRPTALRRVLQDRGVWAQPA